MTIESKYLFNFQFAGNLFLIKRMLPRLCCVDKGTEIPQSN